MKIDFFITVNYHVYKIVEPMSTLDNIITQYIVWCTAYRPKENRCRTPMNYYNPTDY